MEPGEIFLRPACPDDADAAGPLIYAAGPTLFSLMFGARPAAVTRLFSRLFRRVGTPFSHEHATLAVKDEQIFGLALAGPLASRGAGPGRLLFLLPRLHPPFALLRAFPRLRQIAACTPAPPAGSYYVSILAVRESERSKGIGKILMEKVCEDARKSDCQCVTLHAERSNERAQSFYRRHGFAVVSERRAGEKLTAAGVTGLVLMRRELT